MAEKELSCAERIQAALETELEEIREAGESVDATEQYEEGILEIDRRVCFKVLLSTGGPESFFTFVCDRHDGEILEIRFHFRDWFDGAEKRLFYEEFETVRSQYQSMMECLVLT